MSISKNNLNDVAVVILAAGEGKRMKSAVPKVLHELNGKPLIEYVVKAVEDAGLPKPIIVVSHGNEQMIKDYLKGRADYVIQELQLGTGDAVLAAQGFLREKGVKHVLILNGDMPYINPCTLRAIIDAHVERKNTITMTEIKVINFEGEFKRFKDFGRVIRKEGNIVKVIENIDATPEEMAIGELNVGCYCIEAEWLWNFGLPFISPANKQTEYYLTNLIGLAMSQKKSIGSILVEPNEAIGINTQEQLQSAHNLKSSRFRYGAESRILDFSPKKNRDKSKI